MHLIKLQFLIVAFVFGLCVYSSSVLAQHETQLVAKHSDAFVPLVYSGNYSCQSQAHFVDFMILSDVSKDGHGCPIGSGGITYTSNCGFGSWQEACWIIGTTPATNSIQYAILALSLTAQFVVMGGYLLFVGRGIIKQNRLNPDGSGGGLHKSTIKFVSRPRIIMALCCVFIMVLICIFHLGQITSNGSFLSAAVKLMPTPPSSPRHELPSHCYNKCRVYIYYGWGFLLFSFVSLMWMDLTDVVKCGSIVCIDNRENQEILARGAESNMDLLNDGQ